MIRLIASIGTVSVSPQTKFMPHAPTPLTDQSLRDLSLHEPSWKDPLLLIQLEGPRFSSLVQKRRGLSNSFHEGGSPSAGKSCSNLFSRKLANSLKPARQKSLRPTRFEQRQKSGHTWARHELTTINPHAFTPIRIFTHIQTHAGLHTYPLRKESEERRNPMENKYTCTYIFKSPHIQA